MIADVAVVGGGPAGAAAAHGLASRGRTAVLLERKSGSEPHLCGEFMSPDGVEALRRLGVLDDVERAGAPRIERFRLLAGRAAVEGRLPAPALGVSRDLVDPLLRRAAASAGAEVLLGYRVESIGSDGRDGRLWALDAFDGRRVRARAVVVATGRGAPPSGVAGDTSPDRLAYVAMKATVPGEPPEGVDVHLLGGGYVGVSAVEHGRVSVCFLARRDAFRRAGRTAHAYLDRAAERHPRWARAWSRLRPGAEPWTAVASMTFVSRRPVRDGVLLAGDAAAQVAPVLGAGQSMALESGGLVAACLARAFDDGDAERARSAYRRAWSRRFRRRLLTGRLLHAALLSEVGYESALRAAALVPGFATWMAALTRAVPAPAHAWRRGTRAGTS